MAAMAGFNAVPYATVAGNSPGNGAQLSPSSRQRMMSRQQQSGIFPLDLAMPEDTMVPGLQHLSPVYEDADPFPDRDAEV